MAVLVLALGLRLGKVTCFFAGEVLFILSERCKVMWIEMWIEM